MDFKDDISRSAFLERIALGFTSVLGIGFAGFSSLKQSMDYKDSFKPITEKEANCLVKNIHTSKSKRIKPEPPPTITAQ